MKLTIDNPCGESWEDMPKLNDTFKFCSVCDKNIYDFASMSKTDVFVTVLTNEKPVCGKLKKEQLQLTADDIPALMSTLQQPRFRSKAFMVLALVCTQLLSSCDNLHQENSIKTGIDNALQKSKDEIEEPMILGGLSYESEDRKKGIALIPPPPPPVIGCSALVVPEEYVMGDVDYAVDVSTDEIDSNETLIFPDVSAEYMGGMSAMIDYLSKNIQYPDYAKENGIQGNVMLRFVVHKDGSLSDFEVLKSPDKSLSDEALRVVKNMPNWKPGENQGKIVNVQTIIPVRFQLN